MLGNSWHRAANGKARSSRAERERQGRQRRCRSRLCLERLEDRTLLNCTFDLGTLRTKLAGALDTTQTTLTTAFNGANAIPLIGHQLQSFTEFANLIKQLDTIGQNLIGTATDTTVVSAVQGYLYPIVNPNGGALPFLGDINGGGIGPDDILVSPNPDCSLSIKMYLHANAQLVSTRVAFDLGLGSFLDVSASSGLQVSIGLDYLLQFSFHADNTITFDYQPNDSSPKSLHDIDPRLPNTALAITVTAALQNFSAHGRLTKLLSFDATDLQHFDAQQQRNVPSGFIGTLGVGIHSDGTLDTPKLNGSAQIDLGLQLQFDPNNQFFINPKLSANFHLTWQFTNDQDVKAPASSFGQVTDVSFDNIQLDLGTLFPKFITDIIGDVQHLTKPLQPIVDVAKTEIPGLSKLGLHVKLRDLLGLKGNGMDDALDAINFINNLPGNPTGSGLIPLGKFSLNDGTSSLDDLLSINLPVPHFNVIPVELPDFNTLLTEANADSSGWFDHVRSGDSQTGFQFPIVDKPADCVWKLLLGGNPTLFSYKMPTLDSTLDATFGIHLGILGLGVHGGAKFKIDLSVGYDTKGLKDFVTFVTNNPNATLGQKVIEGVKDAFHGFYIQNTPTTLTDNQNQQYTHYSTGVNVQGFLEAFAQVGVRLSGGVYANVDFHLDPSQNDLDNRIHLDDIIARIQSAPLCLFEMKGQIYVQLTVSLAFDTPFGHVTLFSQNVGHAELVNFDFACKPPTTPTPDPHVIVLNMIDGDQLIHVRKYTGVNKAGNMETGVEVDYSDHKEFFPVTVSDPNQVISDRMLILATNMPTNGGGFPREVHGNHIVIVDEDVKGFAHLVKDRFGLDQVNYYDPINAVLIGGDGNDDFEYGAPGTAILIGGAGNNTLVGGHWEFGGGIPSGVSVDVSSLLNVDLSASPWVQADVNWNVGLNANGNNYLTGTTGDDHLYGASSGTNVFNGLGGTDHEYAGTGDNLYLVQEFDLNRFATLTTRLSIQGSGGLDTVALVGLPALTPNVTEEALITSDPAQNRLDGRNAIDLFTSAGTTQVFAQDVNTFSVQLSGGSVRVDDLRSTDARGVTIDGFRDNQAADTVTVQGAAGFSSLAVQDDGHGGVDVNSLFFGFPFFRSYDVDIRGLDGQDLLVLDPQAGLNSATINTTMPAAITVNRADQSTNHFTVNRTGGPLTIEGGFLSTNTYDVYGNGALLTIDDNSPGTANIYGTGAPLVFNGVRSHVNVGVGSTFNIKGDVYVFRSFLDVDDTNGGGEYATVHADSITDLAPATIHFLSLVSLTIDGGSTGSFTIKDTPHGIATALDMTGTSVASVEATHGPLDISGGFLISIGQDLEAISAPIKVLNPGTGSMVLIVDDRSDPSARAVTLSKGSGALYTITGLVRAPISFTRNIGLTIYGSSQDSRGNIFTINDTAPAGTTIYTGRGEADVLGTTGPLGVSGGSTVLIGNNGSLQGIHGAVSVGGPSPLSLTVDDSNDSASVIATFTKPSFGSYSITGLAPASISYYGKVISDLTVKGPTGSGIFNDLTIEDTAPDTVTDLNTGYSGFVHVHGTSGKLIVRGGYIFVGEGNVQNINGDVIVRPTGTSTTSLSVDDHQDPQARMVTLGVQPSAGFAVTGLAPATISYPPAIAGLSVRGGSGGTTGNVFTITDTASNPNGFLTSVNPGNGIVNVHGTTGLLEVDGATQVNIGNNGTVQAISGAVIVRNPIFVTTPISLVIDDRSDTTTRTVALDHVNFNIYSVTGLAPAEIDYLKPDVTALTIYGSGNTYNVHSTPDGTTVTFNDGTRGASINVGSSANTLDAINGRIIVNGQGNAALNINDQGTTTPQIYTLTDVTVSRGQVAPITYTGLNVLAVNGGSGGNTFTLNNPGPFNLTLNTGTGNNHVNVSAISGTAAGTFVNIDGDGGNDMVTIGSQAPVLGGTVANIYGSVFVRNDTGHTDLIVDNSGETLQESASMSHAGSGFNVLGPGQLISHANIWPADNGHVSLTYYGGPVGGSFLVYSTAGMSTTLNLQGPETVNVLATLGPLTINGGGGTDTINIGPQLPIHGGGVSEISPRVTLSNPGGQTALTVDDSNATVSRTATITSNSITDLPAGTTIVFANANLTCLTIKGGSGGNTFFVNGTPSGATTSLNSGAGSDQVYVQATSSPLFIDGGAGANNVILGSTGTLANFQGPVTVTDSDPLGAVGLSVQDGSDPTPKMAVTLDDGSITGLAPAAIKWTPAPNASPTGGVTTLFVTGGGGGNTFNVKNTSKFYHYTLLVGGYGSNSVTVQATTGFLWIHGAVGEHDNVMLGSQAPMLGGTLANINGPVLVDGASSTTDLSVDNGGDPYGHSNVTLSYDGSVSTLSGLAPAMITWAPLGSPAFGAVTHVSIYNGTGSDLVNVQSAAAIPMLIDGGGGTNTLRGPDAANTWQVAGINKGMLNSNITFASFQNLTGGSAGDTFALKTGGSLSGKIDGGAGTNTLDYSAYLGDVTVDLPLDIATAVAMGVLNIQNITGSQGNDILVGDANPNVLKGGTGRNLIIGGAGADLITGGGGDNILIGGTTAYDTNLAALQAILHEFLQTYDSTDPANDFNIRVNNIRKGVGTLKGTGIYLDRATGHNAATVFGDGAADDLTSGGGFNWFLVDAADVVHSTNPNDRVTRV